MRRRPGPRARRSRTGSSSRTSSGRLPLSSARTPAARSPARWCAPTAGSWSESLEQLALAWRGAIRAVRAAAGGLLIFHGEGGDARNLVAVVHAHDCHALGVAAKQADLLHAGADHDPGRGYEHELLAGRDHAAGGDFARLVRDVQGLHALAAAALERVFGHARALTE